MKIRIARSDNPLGPFLNWSEPFCNNDTYSYIDGDLYIDGQDVYLFYVRDCSVNVIDGKHVSQIYVSKVKSDLTALEGPSSLILTPDQSWEGIQGDWMWNEGPFVFKNNNKLYLFYSANVYSSADYSVGVAVADSPMGSWKKYPDNPVLRKDMSQKISGPGHCMVTYSPDSTEMFMVYHTHTFSDKPSGNRNMCIDRLIFENDIPKVIGPTRTPQPLPSGVKFRIKN
jgi:GH43 family beta-xylosidase